jgi:hypothetical protein
MPLSEAQLSDLVRDVALQVHTAEERKEDRTIVAGAHEAVAKLAEAYRELCASVSEMERMKIERSLGRRVTDLRRLASLLPKVGNVAATSTPDRQVAGASVIGERKITGVSWGAGERGVAVHGSKLRVGGDVEAWCGPCGGMTTHSIVAMVGDEPKQVACQVCNNRHNYRTTPARKTASDVPGAGVASASRAETENVRRAEQKADELRRLSVELADAEQVRDWNPKERYRVGEVLSHPDFGRGKVETVLRSSLLVRFARGGLKSLMLV